MLSSNPATVSDDAIDGPANDNKRNNGGMSYREFGDDQSFDSNNVVFSYSRNMRGKCRGHSQTWDELIEAKYAEFRTGKKDGPAVQLGKLVGKDRKKSDVEEMYAIGLDYDSGVSYDKIEARVAALGVAGIMHTTFSHNKTTSQLKLAAVHKFFAMQRPPTAGECARYMRDVQNIQPHIVDGLTILDDRLMVPGGEVVLVKHEPIEKFRVILPLAEPVIFKDKFSSNQKAVEEFAAKVFGLGVEMIGEGFDAACHDASRLFYLPAVANAAAEADARMTRFYGPGIKYEDIPKGDRKAYLESRKAPKSAFESFSGDIDDFTTPSGKDLKKWAAKFAHRFEIATAITEHGVAEMRTDQGVGDDKVSPPCPFEDYHSNFGGSGFFVENAGASDSGTFAMHCMHDSCQGRDRLEFLAAALDQGYLPESALTDEMNLLDPSDQDLEDKDDDDYHMDGVVGDASPADPEEAIATTLAEIDNFPSSASDDAVRAALRTLHSASADRSVIETAKAEISRRTALRKSDVNRFEKQVLKCLDANKVKGGKDSVCVQVTGIDAMFQHAKDRLKMTNEKDRTLFYSDSQIVKVAGEDGARRVSVLDRDGIFHEFDERTLFTKVIGEEENKRMIKVGPPEDVMKKVRGADNLPLDKLDSIVKVPAYTADGRLLNQPGYDKPSGMYVDLAPELTGMDIPDVPTEADVASAKALLIEDGLADFPFDAMDREEIVSSPENCQSLKNTIGMILMPFVMALIDGPTPGHLITKPARGTGSGLLTEACLMISFGQRGTAKTFTSNEEEYKKELLGDLERKAPYLWYDNAKKPIGGSVLEAAMTTTILSGRRLGRNDEISAAVRCLWIFTGNNASVTSDVMRRCTKIVIDARSNDPTKRTHFRHPRLLEWIKANRRVLVRACLILIQNWIAKGSKKQTTGVLASFESWHEVMGGIIMAAELGELKPNHEIADDYVSLDDGVGDDETADFVAAWWCEFKDTATRAKDRENCITNVVTLAGLAIKENFVGMYEDYERPTTHYKLRGLRNMTFDITDREEKPLSVIVRKDKKEKGVWKWHLEQLPKQPQAAT